MIIILIMTQPSHENVINNLSVSRMTDMEIMPLGSAEDLDHYLSSICMNFQAVLVWLKNRCHSDFIL